MEDGVFGLESSGPQYRPGTTAGAVIAQRKGKRVRKGATLAQL